MTNLFRKCCFCILVSFLLFFHSISFAEDNAPLFSCTLTDSKSQDGESSKSRDEFTVDTPAFYLSCYSDHVNKGQKLKSVWIAEDTNNVAPANYKIDEKEIVVSPDVANEPGVTADFSLSKPTNGWPLGSYHVDLYVDGKLDQSISFSVK